MYQVVAILFTIGVLDGEVGVNVAHMIQSKDYIIFWIMDAALVVSSQAYNSNGNRATPSFG